VSAVRLNLSTGVQVDNSHPLLVAARHGRLEALKQQLEEMGPAFAAVADKVLLLLLLLLLPLLLLLLLPLLLLLASHTEAWNTEQHITPCEQPTVLWTRWCVLCGGDVHARPPGPSWQQHWCSASCDSLHHRSCGRFVFFQRPCRHVRDGQLCAPL
jgi:hypothetical protein